MDIYKEVYDYIIDSVPKTPPETGGILGAKEKVICSVQLDNGISQNKFCSYEPNTIFLNSVIEEWQNMKINFVGIFHTHFYGVESLSEGDKEYIKVVMESMSHYTSSLYFPIVLSDQNRIVCYKAIRQDTDICIINEKINIVEKENRNGEN